MVHNLTDSFCVIPWVQMTCKTKGTARFCCLARASDGSLVDSGLSFATDNLSDIHNSHLVTRVRHEMLLGKRPPECSACWSKEDGGANSKRLVSNRMYKDEFTIEDAIEETDFYGMTTHKPDYWDLRFGNLCNLKCVMCHPSNSTQWYEDYVAMTGCTSFGQVNLIQNEKGRWVDPGELDWWRSQGFWDQMEENIPYLKRVCFVGGEPMLIEPHYDFLQRIVDSGRASKVTIEYDTNLTNVQDRAIELWKQFKEVSLRVSLDDYGEQNDYIRFPSNWDSIWKNIERVRTEVPNARIEFGITWQVLNSFTILNLLHHLKDENYFVRVLQEPSHYNVKILPKSTRQILVDMYEEFGDNRITHLIHYLENVQGDPDVASFLDVTKRLDRLRGTDFEATFADLNRELQNGMQLGKN